MQDSISVSDPLIETSITASESTGHYGYIFTFIAFVAFGLIIYLLSKRVISKEDRDIKRNILDGEIDFDNIINSSHTSKSIYDDLKVKCHPDRFAQNDQMSIIAIDLFQKVIANKTNTKELLKLRSEIEKQLHSK